MFAVENWQLTDEQVEKWIAEFLPLEGSYFFDDPELALRLEQAGWLVFHSRKEWMDGMPGYSLEYAPVYLVWGMSPDTNVIVAEEQAVEALEEEVRIALLQQQCKVARGHVYKESRLRMFGEQADTLAEVDALLAAHSFEYLGERHLVLTANIWYALSKPLQTEWFRQWFLEMMDGEPLGYRLETVELPDSVTPAQRELLARYVDTYPDASGPNCFASALSMASGNLDTSPTLFNRWLHPGPLKRMLEALGYERADSVTAEGTVRLQPGDVPVWVNAEGTLIHAAYALTSDLVFNKMGQIRCQPWQIIDFDSIRDYAETISGGGCLDIYRKRG